MNITKVQNSGKTVLLLSGRLDTVTAEKFQEALIPEFETVKYVELDFAGLEYVSSAGLRVLLLGEKAARANDSKQTLVNVPEEIMEIFDMTAFSGVLNIE